MPILRAGSVHRPLLRRSVATVGVAVAVTALSACGSSGGGGGTGSAGGQATDVAACTAAVGGLETSHLAARTQQWYPTSGPAGALAKGKTFWYVPVSGSVASAAGFGKGFAAAAKAVGASAHIADGGGTPAGAVKAVNLAVAAHADAIVLGLITPALIPSALANAKQAGIPVVAGEVGLLSSPPAGISGQMSQDDVALGSWEADSALVKTRCATHALLVYTAGSQASELVAKGIRSTFAKQCAQCSITDATVAVPDIATKTESLVENKLRTNPAINVVIAVSSPYVSFISAGLKALNSKVPLVTSANMGEFASQGSSTPIVGAVNFGAPEVHGWFYMQAVLEALGGTKAVKVQLPLGYVDASNRSSTDPSSYRTANPYEGYQAKFKALWKVTS